MAPGHLHLLITDHNIPGLDGNNYQEPLGTQPAKEYIKSEILNENSKEENDPVKIENDGVQNTVPGQTFSSELSKMNIGFSLASDFYNDDLGQSDASQADRELEIDTESGGGTNLQPGDVRDWVTCIIKQETVEQADYDNVKNTNDSEEPVRSVKVEVVSSINTLSLSLSDKHLLWVFVPVLRVVMLMLLNHKKLSPAFPLRNTEKTKR